MFSLQKLSRDHSDEDCFFDLLSKFQSSRMDDQRCHLDEPTNGENTGGAEADSLNDVIGQPVSLLLTDYQIIQFNVHVIILRM